MENLSLVVEERNKEERAKNLREEKMIPAIVYGHSQEPVALKVNYSDFLRTYRKSWESHIINMKFWKKEIEVLVHEVQRAPVSWDFTHIDFFAITKWEKLTAKIHLSFVWSSKATKEWAVIEEHIKELEVKCLPKDLVDSFEVDLSELENMWDAIRISDLKLDSNKYEVMWNENDIVVIASKPAKVEIEEVTTEEKWEENKEKEETENK